MHRHLHFCLLHFIEVIFCDGLFMDNRLYQSHRYLKSQIRVRYPNGGFAKDVPVRIRAYNDDERPIAGAPRRPEHTDAYGRASFIVPTEPSYTQIRVDFEIGQHKRSMPAHYTFRAHKERQYIALKKVPPEMQFEVGTSFPVEVHFKPENAFSGAIVAIIAAGMYVFSTRYCYYFMCLSS